MDNPDLVETTFRLDISSPTNVYIFGDAYDEVATGGQKSEKGALRYYKIEYEPND